MRKTVIDLELEQVRQENGGVLRPKEALQWAKEHKDSALHSRLEWNDEIAGEQYRLEQIRRIIRVRVQLLPKGDGETVKVSRYVSLPSDRETGDSYRTVVDVMDNEQKRDEFLEAALRELAGLQKKYRELIELSDIWDAIDRHIA
jgi:hypothetical protein